MPSFNFPPLSSEDLRRIVDFLKQRLEDVDLSKARELLPALASLWQTSGFVAPFDWAEWLREKGGESWATDREVLGAADLATIRRLATAHLRINRFVDGHLEHLLSSGYLERLRKRLEELIEGKE